MVGLTGGIGAGKSTLAGLLAEQGAAVIDVDAVGRDVISPEGAGGEAVLAAFGTTDRREIAKVVFADPAARLELESISWPLIEAELRRLVAERERAGLRRPVAEGTADVVVLDMAVLPQGLGKGIYGPVVTVEAPVDVRIERLVARGMTADDAIARMRSQTSDDHRRSIADFIVENDDRSIDDLRRIAADLAASLRAWTR